jgi:hypothetical protein
MIFHISTLANHVRLVHSDNAPHTSEGSSGFARSAAAGEEEGSFHEVS